MPKFQFNVDDESASLVVHIVGISHSIYCSEFFSCEALIFRSKVYFYEISKLISCSFLIALFVRWVDSAKKKTNANSESNY